ncbi:zinc ribbon domain-containing protein [uncultured Sunxiuqinia sp.]|uniref:zinc ribbon domain-containing protein n=1 Tax=Sunxiuqinia rutila TaxID=1397841 RepID=UPI002617AACB|nr:zinc ribbon domain-containing protein [uncultured Sunxiuqinia sp.]
MRKVYVCPKCGGKKPEVDEIRTTGSGFTKYFNIQNRRFTAVSCTACGYTELYKGAKLPGGSSVLDFVTN